MPGYARRGVGRYVASLSGALARIGRLAGVTLAPELPPAGGMPAGVAERGLVHWDDLATTRRLVAGPEPIVRLVGAPFLHVRPDDPTGLVVAPHWARAGVPCACILYDLIPLRAPRHYLAGPGEAERYRARAEWVARADVVLAISEHTRQEAIELLGCRPDQVVTIGAGVSPAFGPGDDVDRELFAARLPGWEGRPFLLCITGSDSRKNTDRLIEALAQIPGTSLAIAGHLTPTWQERLAGATARAGVADRVVLLGEVSDELLRACYRRATLTVMPSLAEGLGLPVLESAACGAPAVASDTTALAEAAGRPEARFDPTDPAAIAACVNRLLGDRELRAAVAAEQAQRAAASTWESVAHKVVDAVTPHVAGPKQHAVLATAKPAIGLVGPLPPRGGGLGRYHADLVAALASRADTTACTDVVAGTPAVPGARLAPTDGVGTSVRPASFDAFVYTVGNSGGHLATVRAALDHPGWLWLHETRLPGIAATALERLDDDAYDRAMVGLLERAYPGRPPLDAAAAAGRSTLDLVDAGVGLLQPLAERSRGILVNSEAARRLVTLDLPPGAAHPPIHVLPPAVAGVRPVTHAPDDGPPVVATFGIVSWAKRPDLLLAACRDLGCRVAFVGPCPPIVEEAIGNIATRLDMADRVTVTGEVDDDAWRGWLGRTAVAVQLRSPSTGEMSAAVLEAMASGIPVVTNLASAADYPDATRRVVDLSVASDLGPAIGALLARPDERRAMVEAALVWCREHTFEALAEQLLSIVGP